MTDISKKVKILWDYLTLNEPPIKSDCILGLGSQDKRVGKYAAELFLKDYAPLIIFSGGKGRLTPKDWKLPEAEEFKKEAILLGVPEQKIITENKSFNTKENMEFAKELILKLGLDIKRIIVVTQPFLERRAKAVFEKYMPDLKSIFSYKDIDFDDYIDKSIPKDEVINMLVGETIRLMEYPKKGYIPPQVIPNSVAKACKDLIELGYTKYMI